MFKTRFSYSISDNNVVIIFKLNMIKKVCSVVNGLLGQVDFVLKKYAHLQRNPNSIGENTKSLKKTQLLWQNYPKLLPRYGAIS